MCPRGWQKPVPLVLPRSFPLWQHIPTIPIWMFVPHKVMWAFPAFPLSNKIRVKYVLGVFDPVDFKYDIGFSQFLTGYATIAWIGHLDMLFT